MKNNFEFSQLFQNRKKVKGKCRLKSEDKFYGEILQIPSISQSLNKGNFTKTIDHCAFVFIEYSYYILCFLQIFVLFIVTF